MLSILLYLHSDEHHGVFSTKCYLGASKKLQRGVILHFLPVTFSPSPCVGFAQRMPEWVVLSSQGHKYCADYVSSPPCYSVCFQDMLWLIQLLLCYTPLCNQNLKASLWTCVKMQNRTLISKKVKVRGREMTVKNIRKPQKRWVSWIASAGYYMELQEVLSRYCI